MIKAVNNNHIKRRRKVMQLTKGFRGRINNCYTLAKRASNKAETNRFISRKENLRLQRRRNIMALNSWARQNDTNYSALMFKMSEYNKNSNIPLNRGILLGMIRNNCQIKELLKI